MTYSLTICSSRLPPARASLANLARYLEWDNLDTKYLEHDLQDGVWDAVDTAVKYLNLETLSKVENLLNTGLYTLVYLIDGFILSALQVVANKHSRSTGSHMGGFGEVQERPRPGDSQ